MHDLSNMMWIELRKAIRSRMPLWTTLGFLFMPLGVSLLILLAKNPELSRKLGLISAKANLIAYSATDWSTYLRLIAEIIGIGGFFFFILSISWVFGREFVDGTLKDMLAVPVRRSSMLLAKFILVAIWSVAMTFIILIFGLVMGMIIRLPGGSLGIILRGVALVTITACLVIVIILPFGFFASVGRGYLLPIGMAVLIVMMANLMVLIGLADYFPWAIPMLYAQGESSLKPISYWIASLSGMAGMVATYLWWKYADQNR